MSIAFVVLALLMAFVILGPVVMVAVLISGVRAAGRAPAPAVGNRQG